MKQIRQASVSDCERLLELLRSDQILEHEGSIYAQAQAMPFLSQFSVETCPSSEVGPGMHWINRDDFLRVFSSGLQLAKATIAKTAGH